MKVKQLQLKHYRNYDQLQLKFTDGLTILTGENAQGKTNLLEAIFLLSMTKSHRTNHDNELIEWGQDYGHVEAIVETRNYEFPISLSLGPKGKIAKVNHIEQTKLSHFIGKLNVVLFAPEDLYLIKGSPSLRRKYIDSELGQSHPVYLQNLLDYNHILKQRNRYLKEHGFEKQFDALYFEIITDQLIEKAVEIIKARIEFVEAMEELAHPIHEQLSNQRDQLNILYKSCSSRLDYSQLDTLTEQLITLFHQSLDREKNRGLTLYGPHRDDLTFTINGKEAQNFASQGQQRTIVLSLKLAEIEWLNQIIGEYPILLLDDVLSELDDNRQHILMNQIDGKSQTFLTTATIKGLNLEQLNHARILYVEDGKITEEGE
ncbi:DNA replication/repair protein RecF [Aerococcaceae bacterium WGS1372]